MGLPPAAWKQQFRNLHLEGVRLFQIGRLVPDGTCDRSALLEGWALMPAVCWAGRRLRLRRLGVAGMTDLLCVCHCRGSIAPRLCRSMSTNKGGLSASGIGDGPSVCSALGCLELLQDPLMAVALERQQPAEAGVLGPGWWGHGGRAAGIQLAAIADGAAGRRLDPFRC